MQWHDRNWMPYRILRGDVIRGSDLEEDGVIVDTKIPLNLFNLIMGVLAGHASHAAYKVDDDVLIYQVEYPSD